MAQGKSKQGGSSQQHAPWALAEYRFREVIAPSSADMLYNTCCKNGLLPIGLTEPEVDRLFGAVKAFPGFRLAVDLERQTVATPDGALALGFAIEAFRKHCLINGLDDIGLTLRQVDAISEFEKSRPSWKPTTLPARISQG